MAESRFLPYQDKNNDRINDECPVDIIPEPNVCPECAPNPKAIVPKWKNRKITEPFLNEKICKFQITVVTKYTTTIDEKFLDILDLHTEVADSAMEDRFNEFVDDAIDSLIDIYDKAETEANKEKLKAVIEYTDFELDPRPKSRLKLLYSVPFDDLNDLDEMEDEEEEEEEELGDTTVKFQTADLVVKMIRVRKGLSLYSRYLKVYRAIEGGNIYFEETGAVFNLDNYGDLGFFPTSVTAELIQQLDAFLNLKGYNIPGTGAISFFKDKVIEIELTFNKDFKLKTLKFWTDGCPNTPQTYTSKKLKALTGRGAWKDATACAYLARLYEMERDMTARVPKPWSEFIIEHTFPKVYAHVERPDIEGSKNPMSCVADALAGELKELGQDILDEVFSLGDAIAYMFHKNLCRGSIDEVLADLKEVGGYPPVTDKTKLGAMAKEQAYKELRASDDVFERMCANFLGSKVSVGGDPVSSLDDLWYHGFDEIKICGLFDLMLDAIKCLLGGLSLEEALASMIQAALKSMGVENMGALFIGLPPEKQAELDALVKKKLESGDIFAPGSGGQELSDAIDAGGTGSPEDISNRGQIMWSKPWDNKEIIDEERRSGGGDSETVPGAPTGEGAASDQKTERTLAEQFDIAGAAENELSPNVVMDAYVKALIDVYSENLMDLLDELNKFPGAQIVATILATLDCPRPPLFNPGIFDFIKDLDLPFCRNMNDIVFPRFENPFAEISNLKDILYLLWIIAGILIQQLIMKIIMMILIKLCELLADAICAALGAVGSIAASLPDLLSGRDNFANIIKDAICGPDADDDQVNDTIADMMESLGPGGAALGNQDKLISFAEDMSSATTRTELMNAFLGEPSDQVLEVIDQLIEFEYPEFRDALSNKQAIASLLGNCGNLMPADFRDDMRNFVGGLPEGDEMPANPSLCATPGQLEQFKELRCGLLEGRATKEQCDAMFDKLRGNDPESPGFLTDLQDISQIMQDGIPAFLAANMPPLISDPGCDNGLLPFEPEELTQMTAAGAAGSWEQLKIAYSTDMLGNGNFWNSDANWGLMNMIMADTMGWPLSAHHRKVYGNDDYQDFIIDTSELPPAPDRQPMTILGIPIFGDPWQKGFPAGPVEQQRGQYPLYLAGWLYSQLTDVKLQVEGGGESAKNDPRHKGSTWKSNNTPRDLKYIRKSFKDLGFTGFWGPDPDPLAVPDLGYNVDIRIKMDEDWDGGGYVRFIRNARKDEPDIELSFVDNGNGLRSTKSEGNEIASVVWPSATAMSNNANPDPGQDFSIGGNIKVFLSDIVDYGSGSQNLPTDNMRLEIYDWVNIYSDAHAAAATALIEREEDEEDDKDAHVKILKSRKYEFIGVDDTLSDFDFTQYPKFNACFTSPQEYIPQIYLLQELLGDSLSIGEVETMHNEIMNTLYSSFLETILEPDADASDRAPVDSPPTKAPPAFIYGAAVDIITPNMFDYVAPQSIRDDTGEFRDDPGGDNAWLMADLEMQDYDRDGVADGYKPVRNGDMVLGVSRDAFDNEALGTPELTRVVYLDPATYGGSYMRPKVTVKPVVNTGWMGFVDSLFPQISPCKPQRTDMVDFGDINSTMQEEMMFIAHDQRLKQDPDCVIERPFNRILERSGKAGVHAAIRAACRIFGSSHMILGMPVFSKFAPRFPEVFSNVYSAYIVEKMEIAFRDAQHGLWEWFNPFKDNEFWYAFLEQAVQTYARLVDDGKIIDPPQHILDILTNMSPAEVSSLNDTQERHNYPWREDLQEAKWAGEVNIFKTLKEYRKEENLITVAAAEENCKIILQEFVKTELNWTGENFMKNLKTAQLTPKHYDLDYYLLEKLTNGGIRPAAVAGREYAGPSGSNRPDVTGLDLEWPIREVVLDPGGDDAKVPGETYYTGGDELANADTNEEYIGYYHVTIGEEDEKIFMEGEVSVPADSALTDSEQSMLRVIANAIVVPIGDVNSFEVGRAFSTAKPFLVEKYTSIDGVRYMPSAALGILHAQPDQSKLISEVYPGSLKQVLDASGQVVGLDGELGVRHGLSFWIGTDPTTAVEVVSVEVDALDYKLSDAQLLEGNSALLYCLILKLKEHKKFQLLSRYIFPMNKVLSTLAIYSTENFMNSIGQITVTDNASYGFWGFNSFSPWGFDVDDHKPGSRADISVSEVDRGDPDSGMPPYLKIDFTEKGNPGWTSFADRSPGWFAGIWVKHWDKWDRVLMRKSTSKLKSIFRGYYHNRDFAPPSERSPGAATIWMQGLRESLRPAPGKGSAPAWAGFVTNAWNAEGGLCDKFDAD